MARSPAAAAALILSLGLSATQAHVHRQPRFTDPELDAALVVDAASGKALYARNQTVARHPASLAKMMTLYLLFDALKAGSLTPQTLLIVSGNAAVQPRAHLRLRAGSTISVEVAIKAMVVCSANDAAVAVAEALGGSEAHFAERMNAKARALGMAHTVFHNATGLPAYFRTPSMSWRGVDYNTHNMLIGNYRGADGIKTGYIDSSGYNLVATAMRGNRRIVAILMGGLTPERRDQAVVALLDNAFARMEIADK